MTQPPYPPQQPPTGQPQWGPPPGQPYPGAPYGPPRPPKNGMSTGAIVAIVLGSVFGGLLLIIVIAAIAVSGDTTASDNAGPKKTGSAAPAPARSSAAQATEEPAEEAPVKVTAKKVTFKPSILHDGGAYTSVEVTVTNEGDRKVDINPLHFSITDTTGGKHQAELGVDENQIDTLDLQPGEHVTGVITGKGKFTPKYVTMAESILGGDSVRGDVR